MKLIRQLGIPLVSYEGVGSVRVEEDSTRLDIRGYFEASHLPSGRVAVGFVPTGRIHRSEIEPRTDPNCELSFEGRDLDYWTLKTVDQTFFSRLEWLFLSTLPHPITLHFSAQCVEAKRRGASETGYKKAHFLVSNLLWLYNSVGGPDAIHLEVQGFNVIVAPVDNYSEVAERLRSMNGVEPTARVSIETSSDELHPLEVYRNFLDNLLYVFRLVTGNQVNWYYGEGFNDQPGSPVERVHKHAATSPYSNTIGFRPLKSGMQSMAPKLRLEALARAFFNDSGHDLDMAVLKAMIDQFINACDETSFLESRGLLATTLTELIASRYASTKNASEFIPRSKFRKEMSPKLKEAIMNTALPEEVKDHVLAHLLGAYRNTFHTKLQSLNDCLNLGLDCSQIARTVRVRNSLVHEGTYDSAFEDGGWFNDYQLTTWLNFIALCRLLGYDGDLPEFHENRRLEV